MVAPAIVTVVVVAYMHGRLVEHDARSKRFPAAQVSGRPRTVLWRHTAPVLDQADLGSCTGNALTQWLNTDFAAPARGQHNGGGFLTEEDAVRLYSLATALDGIPGRYPPEDTGSSGLAVCKAGRKLGYLTSYRHCFGMQHMLAALQLSPVIVGTEWFDGMYTPDGDGVIHAHGRVVGGHEYLVIGCDVDRQTVTILNSWGPGWGSNGRAQIGFEDFAALLAARGDVTVPVV